MTKLQQGARYRSSPSATSGSLIAAAPKMGRTSPVNKAIPNVIVPVAASTPKQISAERRLNPVSTVRPGPLGLLAYAPP